MKIEEILENRRSCRKYSTKEVPKEYIEKILWAGTRAPYASGGPRRLVVVVRDKENKLEVQKACYNQKYIGECDTIFIACATDLNTVLRSGFPKYVHDCDASLMCMDIMATSLGLGTCWIGHFQNSEVAKAIKTDSRPTIILLVGYRDE